MKISGEIVNDYINFFNKNWLIFNNGEDISIDYIYNLLNKPEKVKRFIPIEVKDKSIEVKNCMTSSNFIYKNMLVSYENKEQIIRYSFKLYLSLIRYISPLTLISSSDFTILTFDRIFSKFFDGRESLTEDRELVLLRTPVKGVYTKNDLFKESLTFFRSSINKPIWVFHNKSTSTFDCLDYETKEYFYNLKKVSLGKGDYE